MDNDKRMENKMNERRALIKNLAVGAVAIPALAASAKAATLLPSNGFKPAEDCRKPGGPLAERLQNIVVRTHHGDKALFYEDLLRDRIVSINFMSIRNDAVYPVTHHLSATQELLGERMGRDIFMYSITVDPEHDTPERLAEFAAQQGVRPGWQFLTPRLEDVPRLKMFFFAHPPGVHHIEDCSMGLCRYGNVELGLWGSFPAKDRPENVVRRFDWITPKERPAGDPIQRGPAILPLELRG